MDIVLVPVGEVDPVALDMLKDNVREYRPPAPEAAAGWL